MHIRLIFPWTNTRWAILSMSPTLLLFMVMMILVWGHIFPNEEGGDDVEHPTDIVVDPLPRPSVPMTRACAQTIEVEVLLKSRWLYSSLSSLCIWMIHGYYLKAELYVCLGTSTTIIKQEGRPSPYQEARRRRSSDEHPRRRSKARSLDRKLQGLVCWFVLAFLMIPPVSPHVLPKIRLQFMKIGPP